MHVHVNSVDCLHGCVKTVGKMCFCTIYCILQKKKGLEIFFRLTLLRKIDLPRKQYTAFISDVKMLLLTRKIRKAYKVHNSFCLHDQQNSHHFSNLEPGTQAKLVHAYCIFPLRRYILEFLCGHEKRGGGRIQRDEWDRKRLGGNPFCDGGV